MAWFLDSIFASGLGPTMSRKIVVRRHFKMQRPKALILTVLLANVFSWELNIRKLLVVKEVGALIFMGSC